MDATPERDAAYHRSAFLCAPAPRSGARHNPKGWDAFRARRYCSLLVWAGQTSSLAPSRSSKIVSIAHVNDYEIGSSCTLSARWAEAPPEICMFPSAALVLPEQE